MKNKASWHLAVVSLAVVGFATESMAARTRATDGARASAPKSRPRVEKVKSPRDYANQEKASASRSNVVGRTARRVAPYWKTLLIGALLGTAVVLPAIREGGLPISLKPNQTITAPAKRPTDTVVLPRGASSGQKPPDHRPMRSK